MKCNKCGVELSSLNQLPCLRREGQNRTSEKICTNCFRKWKKEYRKNHIKEDKIYDRNYSLNLKKKVVYHYSNGLMKCMNLECEVQGGAKDIRALSIDHINNGGCKHRRDIGKVGGQVFYKWLIDNGYPKGYQVLCMNCQFIKRITSGIKP